MRSPGLDPADYLLPEPENRRIFHQRIVPTQMWGISPRETPVAVFLVGQQGAGKSRVSEMIAKVLNRHGGFVDVDSDLYKPYHPDYDGLMARDDKMMAACTGADGRAWTARAHKHVREHRLNAIVHTTSQNGPAVGQIMEAYRQAGFRVEVLALGVPEAMSNQGIVARYHEQVKDRGRGRLTVKKNADQSYEGILNLASRVDEDRLADQVGVYRRGEGQPRYANALDEGGQWRNPPALRGAIEGERIRPWTETEATDFLRLQGRLRKEMGPEWGTAFGRIEQLASPLIKHTAAYAYWVAMQSVGPVNHNPLQRQIGPAASALQPSLPPPMCHGEQQVPGR